MQPRNPRNGRMRDFTADHISSEEGAELIAHLNATLSTEFPARFFPGVSYRHRHSCPPPKAALLAALVAMECTPPRNITDQEYAPHLPQGEGAELILRHDGAFARSVGGPSGQPAADRRKQTARHLHLALGTGQSTPDGAVCHQIRPDGRRAFAADLVKGMGVLAGWKCSMCPVPRAGSTPITKGKSPQVSPRLGMARLCIHSPRSPR